jgi:carbohydrate diacid regulator
MISIDRELAQEIVVRTAKFIPYNVNVMDAHGIVLGSGDAARIGELHVGAQLAIARRQMVEIDASEARTMPGVKAGINLPLTVRGSIVGVVGLTGDPECVRQFGELVRVTAEMILEQAQLIGELQRDRRYREEFVWQLVSQTGTSPAELAAWAVRLGVDFRSPCTVALLELTDESLPPDLALIELQRCQAALSAHQPDILSATLSPRELVVLVAVDTSARRSPVADVARRRLAELAAIVQKDAGTAVALALGVALSGIEGVALSYQSARRTLRIGRSRQVQGTLFSYYDLSLPVLLAGLASGWQAEQLRQPLLRLNAGDTRNGSLRRTVEAWFAHNANAADTARALHIHRNTLDYRLRRTAEITGLDLASLDDRLLLYVALQLE